MKINGSLVFDASSASEIQNLRVQKYTGAAVPAHTAADVGRAIYVTADGGAYAANTLYIGGASAWIAIATGGNAAALQTEVDAIETSLGAIVGADGVFVPGQVTILGVASTATTVTGILAELAAAISGKDALAELVDVTLTAPADNDLLQYNGAEWVNASIGAVSGVQAYDAGLDSLAAVADAGIVVQTAENFFAARSLVAPVAGLTITDPAGIAGNPTFALANDLAALEGLAGSGYIVRTGDGTATTRAITGTTDNIVVTNGDGVSSDTTINLADVTQAATGSFVKVTLDGFGRVTGNTAVVTADITALVDATYVNVAGDTMASAANLTFVGGGTVTGLPSPTGDTDAANKAYVDALAAGLSWKDTVRAATTGNVTLSGAQTVDGVALVDGDRVLVKDQTAPAENGIYVVAAGAWVRATDMDTAAEFDGSAVFVQEGTTNQGAGYTETATVATVGTDAVVFSQFTGGALYTWGVGLVNTGNTINVNLGSGIFEQGADAVGIELHDAATGAIILTTTGTDRSTSDASKLHLLLAAAGGLEQGATGLLISAAGVTNAMLANPSITLNADAGTNTTLDLGGTLEIAGSSTTGILTTLVGQTITVSGVDASTTQKGVASFDTAHFSTAAGVVSLAASLDDLTNVAGADAAADGSVIQKVGGEYTAVSAATVVSGATLGDLSDVGTATPTDGHALIGDGTVFNTQKIFHLHDEAVAATTWTVTHSIGQQYCNVTVIVEDEVVIPQSITFSSTTALVVTFNTAVAGKVVVMGVA